MLTKACETSGLVWSINNGVLQVKKPGDTMSREVYELSAETGLVGTPERVQISEENGSFSYGWDVEYLMNAAINIDDFVYLNSKYVRGYFRVYSVVVEGDTDKIVIDNLEKALAEPGVQIRIFGKPEIKGHRRMAVILATDESVEAARAKADRAYDALNIEVLPR